MTPTSFDTDGRATSYAVALTRAEHRLRLAVRDLETVAAHSTRRQARTLDQLATDLAALAARTRRVTR